MYDNNIWISSIAFAIYIFKSFIILILFYLDKVIYLSLTLAEDASFHGHWLTNLFICRVFKWVHIHKYLYSYSYLLNSWPTEASTWQDKQKAKNIFYELDLLITLSHFYRQRGMHSSYNNQLTETHTYAHIKVVGPQGFLGLQLQQ